MKIKTITCHEVYNYGATLQAYALMKYLQNLGHHVEIINYKPDYLSGRYNLFELSPRFSQNLLVKFAYLCVKVPIRLSKSSRKRKYAFDKFTQKYLNITKERYKNNDELKANRPNADIFFCGSDQIWNTMDRNGKDPAFYLDFVPQDSIRASYAASFGTDSIFAGYEEFVKTKIDSLDKISVRETKGLDIVKGLGIDRGTHVMDPVFLLENEAWLNIAAKSFNKKYILVYDFENNPLIEACAKKMSKEKKLEIYSINDYRENPYADVNIKDAGPDKFLSLIINSEVFLSNSFHGTAYCVIFKKNFYVFNRNKQKNNSRMTDLLGQLNLSNRLISEIEHMKNDSIDFSYVSIKLDALVKQSKDYIKSVLEYTK